MLFHKLFYYRKPVTCTSVFPVHSRFFLVEHSKYPVNIPLLYAYSRIRNRELYHIACFSCSDQNFPALRFAEFYGIIKEFKEYLFEPDLICTNDVNFRVDFFLDDDIFLNCFFIHEYQGLINRSLRQKKFDRKREFFTRLHFCQIEHIVDNAKKM